MEIKVLSRKMVKLWRAQQQQQQHSWTWFRFTTLTCDWRNNQLCLFTRGLSSTQYLNSPVTKWSVEYTLHSWDKTLHFINKSTPPQQLGAMLWPLPLCSMARHEAPTLFSQEEKQHIKGIPKQGHMFSQQTDPPPSGESLVYYRGLKSRLVKPICEP